MGGLNVNRLAAIVVLAGMVLGCAGPSPQSPDSIVQGALRSSVEYVVAPAAYRSGLLPAALATEWIARAESDYGQWYRGPALNQHLLGLRNVVGALTTQAGPIATSVEVKRIEADPAVVDGDYARVDQASIWYVTHYAAGTWNPADVPGVTMCHFGLRRASGEWRVEDEGCNVSGG